MRGEWIRKPKSGTSVVFVHGILSSGEACWQHENGSYWPELLKHDPEFELLGIYVFTYQTNIFSRNYRLSDIVDALKEHMRLDGLLKSERIIFVCHSMGGLVVRKFIVERATELAGANIEIGLFLVASPSIGSSYANWLSPLAKFLKHAQADVLRFKQSNAWLNDLDKEFQNLKEAGKLRIKGKELIEDKFIILKKFWLKQVVEPFAGARYFGEPFKVPQSDHFSIAKPDSAAATQHRLLCQFINSIFLPDFNMAPGAQEGGEPTLRPSPTASPPEDLVPVSPSDFIPSKIYRRLIGRWQELSKILPLLRQDKDKQAIAIIGLGGIGKTALAREVIDRCRNEEIFDGIVWVSAKTEYYEDGSVRKLDSDDLTFERVLAEISTQCGRNDIHRKTHNEKLTNVQALLVYRHILIVIDNLDTVPNYEELASKLYAILGQSKLLFTSRFHVKGDYIYAMPLRGLDTDAGLEFLKEEAKARNVEAVSTTSETKLTGIHSATGGAPLAMKLVVGQMSRQPLELVLEGLKHTSIESPNYEFYRFLYKHSWELLDENAKKVLVNMSVLVPLIGGPVHAVREVCKDLKSSAFGKAVDQLVALSLVDKIGPGGRERLAMHPLTQYFIRSDITHEWKTNR